MFNLPLMDDALLKQFKDDMQSLSLQEAARAFIKAVGVELEVDGTLPETGAVLLIPNHPSGIDGFVMLAAVDRPDFCQVGLAMERLIGEDTGDRLFPIYRRKKPKDVPVSWFASRMQSHVMADEVLRKQKNRNAVQQAAETVSQGCAVSMFPEGVAGKALDNSTWKPGIGFLVKQITDPSTKVVFAHIDGTESKDLYRMLHPALRSLIFSQSHVKVTFADALPLFDLVNQDDDGKVITRTLESVYRQTFS